MKEHSYNVKSCEDTGKFMYQLVKRYSSDIGDYASFSLDDFFNVIKKIPYKKDPPGIEYLQRPEVLLKHYGKGADCDDKSIAIASWAKENGLPYRFIASGKFADKPYHHVYVEMLIRNKWIVVDATYPENVLGFELFKPAKKQILKDVA